MPQQQSPWLDAKYGWNFGESNWNTGVDENLLKFSFMFDRNVDSIVASLPAAVNGQAHYLTTDNRLYFAVGTTYFSTVVPKWFEFKDRTTGNTYQFNGTDAVQIDSSAQLDFRLDAVELTVASLGTAAFEDVSAFATATELDVVEGQAQGYTDALRQDLTSSTDPAKGAEMVGFRGRTVHEKLSDIGSLKDAGAIGDGIYDDTVAVQAAIASGDVRAEGGVFSVSDTVPTVPLYGTGEIVRSTGRVKLSPVPQISVSEFVKSDQPLSAINQMGMQIVNGLLFVVNQGSYNGTQQGTLDIFDVSDYGKVTRLSSLNIGAIGEIPRALSVFGKYAYVRNFGGGVVRIVDVSDPINPVVLSTKTLLSGNSEHSVIIGRALIYTKLTGDVDFYDISNPLDPLHVSTLTLPGVLHRPTVDGVGFWVTSHNNGTANNLFYVDCSDIYNPQVISSATLPTLKYCRFTTLQGRYMYAGGVDTTSRWNVIDISDRANPVVVYTDTSTSGAVIEACGDVLIADSLLYDITNPAKPVLFGSAGPYLYKIQLYGNRAIGFGESTGPKGPSGNDSNADTYVVSVELNGIRVPAANIEHLKTKRVYAEDISVRNSVSASAVSAGRGGVHTLGVASSNEVVNASGNYQNGQLQATGMAVVRGLLSDPVALFKVHTSRTVFFRLRYHLVNNNSLATSASTAIGEKVWSGFISSVGVWSPLISPVDVYTPFKNNLDLPLTVTVSTNGTPGSPATISVQAAALSSGNPAGFFELSVSSYLPCRIERLV